MENPTVFVSYSHDSDEHKAWVLKLATDLRSHGVDAILDQWDLRLGTDLRFFMENGLSSSALVLCVCSENYVQKVDSGVGGAGYEGMIMTQGLLQNANTEFIIPVVRNNHSVRKVPLAFSSKLYIDFSDNLAYVSKYQELLERIYGEDTKKKPPLGKSPFSSSISHAIDIKTSIAKDLYSSPAMYGNVTFRYDNNCGQFKLGSGEYTFVTKWSGANKNIIYAIGDVGFIGCKDGSTTFPTLAEIDSYDFTNHRRRIHKGDVFVYRNKNDHFVAIKMGAILSRSHGDQVDEMSFEYRIISM